jgi:hypothetical protein
MSFDMRALLLGGNKLKGNDKWDLGVGVSAQIHCKMWKSHSR